VFLRKLTTPHRRKLSSLFHGINDNYSPAAADDPAEVFKFLTVQPDQTGFGAHLKPIESKLRASKGSDSLEEFISDVEMTLISLVLEEDNDHYRPNTRAQETNDVATQVSDNDHVIIPTDRTNSLAIMPTDEHKQKALRRLLKDGK
jgi:hypothetical protein